jgi:hypothetical protein
MDKRKPRAAGTRAVDVAGDAAGTATHDEHAERRTGDELAAELAAEAAAASAGDGASSRRVEPVAAAGTIPVDVDRPAILEEAAAIAASSSSSSIDTPAGELEAPIAQTIDAKAAEVAPAIRLLVAQCAGTFAPNWEITKQEGDGVADAAALVMAHWMPDGVLEPKYLAIIALAASLYGVAGARRLEDGSWLPLRKPRAPSSSSSSPAPPSAPSPAKSPPLALV